LTAYAATIDDVRAAAARIDGRTHRTPVATCASLDARAGRRLFFKCEHLQKGGSFKLRGAWNAVAKLDDAAAARGVAAHVVMPASAPAVKRRAVEEYGAHVIPSETAVAAREAKLALVLAETGAAALHPYDHADVIAGQGTAALELLADVPDLDALVVPVGGGGLISGCAIAARALVPAIRIVGAEPLGADDAARSKRGGALVPQTAPTTIADGLVTSLGKLTWPVMRDQVDEIATVDEAEIVAAMRLAWERAKLLVEPSAAVALAAVLSDGFRAKRGLARVGVILSGGNVDLDRLPW
jgi:threonine dehydratase/serine racemase